MGFMFIGSSWFKYHLMGGLGISSALEIDGSCGLIAFSYSFLTSFWGSSKTRLIFSVINVAISILSDKLSLTNIFFKPIVNIKDSSWSEFMQI